MNDNYLILYYDVGEKRVGKVFKICKKYLVHAQNSVFRGEISPSLTIKLKEELNKVIKDEDQIVFIKMMNSSSFREEVLSPGIKKNDKKNKENNKKFL